MDMSDLVTLLSDAATLCYTVVYNLDFNGVNSVMITTHTLYFL